MKHLDNELVEISIDPLHSQVDPFAQQLVQDIWKDKYRFKQEADPLYTLDRVAQAVGKQYTESHPERLTNFRMVLANLLLIPAGRIIAGAGTDKIVTLINCFVMKNIPDALSGIADVFKDCMLTMQQGGGIGLDFSTLRPSGAYLKRTQAIASGPLPFMDMWDAMCKTMKSAGGRRGAMMACMRCDHPDIMKFITAKHEKGRLTNFNVSVLITDKFMKVLNDPNSDYRWHLKHKKGRNTKTGYHPLDDSTLEHIYETIDARDLWDAILQSTYEYAEPGVIFIDRVNDRNNLKYCEVITATNPCGEQPMAADNACDLAALNLSRFVSNPFDCTAKFNWNLLEEVVPIAIDFLDCVLDITNWPLEDQKREAMKKRRLGLGVTGVADMLAQLGMPYGSPKAVDLCRKISGEICNTAYIASAKLADEKGPFELYDKRLLQSYVPSNLPLSTKNYIKERGLRNGTLTTIAPTGTTSILAGNISSGIEPVFQHTSVRKVLQADNSYEEYTSHGYGALLYGAFTSEVIWKLPDYMNTAEDISVQAHIAMQAAFQEWTDAAISKTVNCPEHISFETFKEVYNQAYSVGLKGVTTYRPSEVRGSVLSKVVEADMAETEAKVLATQLPDSIHKDASGKVHIIESKTFKDRFAAGGHVNPIEVAEAVKEAFLEAGRTIRGTPVGKPILQEPAPLSGTLWKRPSVMHGSTYKIKWPSADAALYLTINDDGKRAYEIFISSKNNQYGEWTTALTRLVSSIMRMTPNIKFLTQELQQVTSVADHYIIDRKHHDSIVAYIGYIIEQHVKGLTRSKPDSGAPDNEVAKWAGDLKYMPGMVYEAPNYRAQLAAASKAQDRICPSCKADHMIRSEGCETCPACGHSTCG